MFKMNDLNWHKEYLYNQDIKAAKQSIYNCGRLLDMRDRDRINFHMTFDIKGDVLSMLLSDSQELLEKFKAWEYDVKCRGTRIVGMTTFLQKLLRGNAKEIQKEFDLYLEYEHQYYTKKEKAFVIEKDPQIMKGLITGDKDAIIDGINWILSDRVFALRSCTSAVRYFSYPATAYLKVAWILGHEIEIDSPYIPMDLMPVQPLKKYEVPYFFMDGYEGEYPEGWLAWKTKDDLGISDEAPKSIDFVWDKNKYASKQEAIIIEAALEKGYRIEKDNVGNSYIYNQAGEKIGAWMRDLS